MKFLEKHWLALVILAVALFVLYQIYTAAMTAANTAINFVESPFQAVSAFFQWIAGYFNGSSPSASSGANGSSTTTTSATPASVGEGVAEDGVGLLDFTE